jgi:hypothetical protein
VSDRLLTKLKPKVRTIPRCHEADESKEMEKMVSGGGGGCGVKPMLNQVRLLKYKAV